MAANEISLPDAKLHIQLLARSHHKLKQPAELEILVICEGQPIQSKRFNPTNPASIEQALKFSEFQNDLKKNIYITPSPIVAEGNPNSACNDTDVMAATHFYVDADDEGAAENLIKEWKQPADFIVVTGAVPHLRLHSYWELDQPTTDIEKWRQLQQFLIDAHSCDQAIKNPSRVMRLGGFLTYPSSKKQERGYVAELVKLYYQGEYHDFL